MDVGAHGVHANFARSVAAEDGAVLEQYDAATVASGGEAAQTPDRPPPTTTKSVRSSCAGHGSEEKEDGIAVQGGRGSVDTCFNRECWSRKEGSSWHGEARVVGARVSVAEAGRRPGRGRSA